MGLVAEVMKRVRHRLNVGNRELGLRLGISGEQVRRIIAGEEEARGKVVDRLCKIYKEECSIKGE